MCVGGSKPHAALQPWGLAPGRQVQFTSRSHGELGEVENSPEKMLTPLHTLWDPGQKQVIAKEPGAGRPTYWSCRVPKEAGGILPPRQTLVHPFPGACSILGVLVNNLEFCCWPSNLQAHLRPGI